jgi:photosystem II stability/assembly factor-like uncharacterized protein
MKFPSLMWARGVALALTVLAPALARAQGFQAVHSPDGIDVWAVGDNGGIYRSFDRGLNWTSQTLGAQTLRGVVSRGFNVFVVSDSGKIWRSQNSGGSWSLTVIPGAPRLDAVVMASSEVAFAVGAGGTIVKTETAGDSWFAVTSGTSAALHAVRFVDESVGWAAGDGGTLLETTSGGVSWSPVAIPTTNAFYALDVKASRVWVAGADGAAWKSTNGGGTFTPVNLKLDGRADVKALWLQSPSTVFLAGGGGFIRKSTDDGQTWVFPIHPMQAQISAIGFYGATGWAANNKNRVVITLRRRRLVDASQHRGCSDADVEGSAADRRHDSRQQLRDQLAEQARALLRDGQHGLSQPRRRRLGHLGVGRHADSELLQGQRLHRVAQGHERHARRGVRHHSAAHRQVRRPRLDLDDRAEPRIRRVRDPARVRPRSSRHRLLRRRHRRDVALDRRRQELVAVVDQRLPQPLRHHLRPR